MRRNAILAFALPAVLWPVAARAQEVLILAPNDFLTALQPLKRFKDATARAAYLVGLTQVYAGFTGADEAEQVKRCIDWYRRNHGVDYVLLVGDIDRFPARYRWWGLPGQEGWAVGDLYYADLYKDGTTTFDTWDSNGNGLYSEMQFSPIGYINHDNIDFLPDVAVGRIPASTEAEVTAYVGKVINYELKTIESAAWFKRAGLYTGSWPNSINSSLMDQWGSSLANEGFSLTKRYWNWTTETAPPGVPGVMVNDMNSGMGFMSYIGHGIEISWSCLDFNTSELSGVTNPHMLPIAFAAACDTCFFAQLARLHPYLDVNGGNHRGVDHGEDLPVGPYPHTAVPRPACIQTGGIWLSGTFRPYDVDCFGESFIFGNPVGGSGGIAYIGERSGAQVTAPQLGRHFFAAYDDGERYLGDMWNHALRQYHTQHKLGTASSWSRDPSAWSDGHIFDEPQRFHLFGDPSLVAGGAFSNSLSGTVSDWPWPLLGPLVPLARYRITGDVTVPVGQRLSSLNGMSLLFETGRKITGLDATAGNGFVISASPSLPAHMLALGPEPQASNVFRGVKVSGQFRLRNGGAIRLHAAP